MEIKVMVSNVAFSDTIPVGLLGYLIRTSQTRKLGSHLAFCEMGVGGSTVFSLLFS